MPCDRDRAKLAMYLDGEATDEEARLLEQHLQTCPVCAAEIAVMVKLRRALRPAASRFLPSEQFRKRVLAEVSSPKRVRLVWLWPTSALALAILVVAAVWLRHSDQRSQTFQEVADLHIADLASTNPFDVVSSDRHTVKPWFQGRIPFAFNLPEFAGTDFTLLGGRLVYLDQQPAAQVLVLFRQHKLSVLILQETSSLATAFPLATGAAVHDSF